jgi:hypothetical protein
MLIASALLPLVDDACAPVAVLSPIPTGSLPLPENEMPGAADAVDVPMLSATMGADRCCAGSNQLDFLLHWGPLSGGNGAKRFSTSKF